MNKIPPCIYAPLLARARVELSESCKKQFCLSILPWQFAMAVCYGRLPWPFAMAVGYGRLLWPLAMTVCHGRWLWPFSMAVGYDRLLWPLAMAVCYGDSLRRFATAIRYGYLFSFLDSISKKAFFIPATKSGCFSSSCISGERLSTDETDEFSISLDPSSSPKSSCAVIPTSISFAIFS